MSGLYLGVEIGGTKLQLGVGAADGTLRALWRGPIDGVRGAEGIRTQIQTAVPDLLRQAGLSSGDLTGVGIGFGGPVDDATSTVIRSHQIDGWDGFPLADWVSELTGLSAALGNDAAVAGLAEAWHGAGKGLSPLFYTTIGSGIGGGLVIDGEMYRGCGRGAGEVGHLRIAHPDRRANAPILPLETFSSGHGMEGQARFGDRIGGDMDGILRHCFEGKFTAVAIAAAARDGDRIARMILEWAIDALSEGICHVIALLCPRRIVIGGGVSLMGEELLFAPLRSLVAQRVFQPFAGLTDIVPAALGEEVVVHGAIELARKRLGRGAE